MTSSQCDVNNELRSGISKHDPAGKYIKRDLAETVYSSCKSFLNCNFFVSKLIAKSIFLSVCTGVLLSVCLFLCPSILLSVGSCVPLSFCLSVPVSFCLSVSVSLYPAICRFLCPSILLSVGSFVLLPVSTCALLSVCTCVHIPDSIHYSFWSSFLFFWWTLD